MSTDADMTLFSNFPGAATDKVYVNVNAKDLHFLVSHSNCKDLGVFFSQVSESFDGQRFQVSYIDALYSSDSNLNNNSSKAISNENNTNEYAHSCLNAVMAAFSKDDEHEVHSTSHRYAWLPYL